MKWNAGLLKGFVLILFISGGVLAQNDVRKLGLGLNVGGQKLYGDLTNTNIGVGVEGLVSYRILPFADVAVALGFSQLRYNVLPGVSNTTDVLNADIRGSFDILSRGFIRPYVTVGGGLINFKVENSGVGRFTNLAGFAGGGIKFRMNPSLDWYVGGDYHLTNTDRLDNPLTDQGKSNDGFFNVRAGVTYYLGAHESGEPNVLAEQGAPFEQIDDNPDQFTPSGNPMPKRNGETKDMEEYVRLKSRIDELTQNVDKQENDIASLQRSLEERKRRLASLENRAVTHPPANVPKSSSMSGFDEIYKEALTNFYTRHYDEAISLFDLLLKQYPNHALASNCQYWKARCFFSLGQYRQSIGELQKVLSYRRSPKKDDALFYLGRAYLKLGEGGQARDAFSNLIRTYPNSEYLEQAKSYLGKL